FLVTVLLMLLLDAVIVFLLAGGLARLGIRRAAALIAAGIFLTALSANDGFAQQKPRTPPVNNEFALRALLQTRLAYVLSGDSQIDNVSRAGLEGLSTFLGQRTALEPADPIAVDVSRDELSFFPMLYWPISPTTAKPNAATLARIDSYMKQGGTI